MADNEVAYSMLPVICCMVLYLCSQVDTYIRLDRFAPKWATRFHALQPFFYYFTQFEVHFAHGFIDILFNLIPPSISSYVQLPEQTPYTTRRGIYILIMQKPGCKPRLYCGSASGEKGIQERWRKYDPLQLAKLPRYVTEYHRKGYKITHKRVLLTVVNPEYRVHDLKCRYFLFSLEGLFTMWLGAYNAQSKHYLSSLCPWKLKDLEYGGLCSRSPMVDLAQYTAKYEEALALSPEELAQMEAEQQASADQRAKEKAEQKAIAVEKRAEKAAIAADERAQKIAIAKEKKARPILPGPEALADLRAAALEKIAPEVLAGLRTAAVEKIAAGTTEKPQRKRKRESEQTPEEEPRKQAKRPAAKPRWETKKVQKMAVTTPEELEQMRKAKLEASATRR